MVLHLRFLIYKLWIIIVPTSKSCEKQAKKSERKFKKYLESNENENTMIQNLWDGAKAVLRGQFTAIQAHLRKQFKQFNLTPKGTRERRVNKPRMGEGKKS